MRRSHARCVTPPAAPFARRSRRAGGVLAALMIVGNGTAAAGQTARWIGPGTGDWFVASNWDTGVVPNGPGATAIVDGLTQTEVSANVNGELTLATLRMTLGDRVRLLDGRSITAGSIEIGGPGALSDG